MFETFNCSEHLRVNLDSGDKYKRGPQMALDDKVDSFIPGISGSDCERYVWFLAKEAQKAFTALCKLPYFRGHDFVGYVCIHVRDYNARFPYMVEMSRGGSRKTRYGPRRPSITFYRYLPDGTRLESDVILGLTEPGSDSDKRVTMLEFLLEQRVIKAAMGALSKQVYNPAESNHNLAYQAIYDTALSVINAFDLKETDSIQTLRDFAEKLGINTNSKAWQDAEDHPFSLLSMIDPAS